MKSLDTLSLIAFVIDVARKDLDLIDPPKLSSLSLVPFQKKLSIKYPCAPWISTPSKPSSSQIFASLAYASTVSSISKDDIACATLFPGLTKPDAVCPGISGFGPIPNLRKPPQCHNCAITWPLFSFIPSTTFFHPSLASSESSLGTFGYALDASWLTSTPSVMISPTSALALLL